MAGDLQDLNPIILPEPVGWLPLAPGWIVLGTLVAIAFAVLAWRRWLAWREQRYRREALRELAAMTDLAELPGLLKRAALSAWPRDRVASLSGPAWHRFLDESAGLDAFSGALGDRLDQLAYDAADLSHDEADSLRGAAQDWLRRHQSTA